MYSNTKPREYSQYLKILATSNSWKTPQFNIFDKKQDMFSCKNFIQRRLKKSFKVLLSIKFKPITSAVSRVYESSLYTCWRCDSDGLVMWGTEYLMKSVADGCGDTRVEGWCIKYRGCGEYAAQQWDRRGFNIFVGGNRSEILLSGKSYKCVIIVKS